MPNLLLRYLALATLALTPAFSQPLWWSVRSVTSGQADDYAAANLGQLKYISTKAADELDSALPDGSGDAISDLIAVWEDEPALGVVRDDYAALNEGQLKAISSLFYDRLAQFGYTGRPLGVRQRYPWTASTSDDDAYSIANLGQLKYVFSFLSEGYFLDGYMADLDLDGIPNGWEDEHGLDKGDPGDADDMFGATTNLVRYELSLNTGGDPASANALGLLVFTP